MLNLFFFSSQQDLRIRYLKSTVKFSDKTKGLTSISFKIWLGKDDFEKIPKLFLLIKKDNAMMLDIDEKYNYFLTDKAFKKTAGVDSTEELKEYSKYAVESITKFEEDETLKRKTLLTPRDIHVKEIDPEIVNKNLKNQKYIKLLRITPIDEETEK
ncbi:MAG: hypothetical protein PVF58_14820, partial [Candidatus Methanofastidiosia archaeon]